MRWLTWTAARLRSSGRSDSGWRGGAGEEGDRGDQVMRLGIESEVRKN